MLWEAGGQKNLSFMSNKKENEELQSRREFFKKAAKAALPVVGAVVLSSLPIVQAEAQYPNCMCGSTCTYQCDGSGNDSCYGSCRGGCNASCLGGCSSYMGSL